MDRRFYILMGVIAGVFCVGSLIFGVDTQSIARRSAVRQKQEISSLHEQLKQEATPRTADEVVVAGY
ncbi:MAG TPA: hypothetical protein VGL38_00825 [bacterium]|jgi:hypothetical protein